MDAIWSHTEVLVVADQDLRKVRLAEDMQSGGWQRARLQLFPDGTCRVAVNGIPVAHPTRRVSLERPFRVLLSGHSYQTRMLHGPLEVWTGVKGDIDWRVLHVSDTAR